MSSGLGEPQPRVGCGVSMMRVSGLFVAAGAGSGAGACGTGLGAGRGESATVADGLDVRSDCAG